VVLVRIEGSDAHEVAGAAQRLANRALAIAAQGSDPPAVIVRGPVPAPIEKLRGRTRWQVWLRSADRHALRRVARGLAGTEPTTLKLRVSLDIDPMSAM
jgi:primosomal protein N' (replication factor Y)